MFGLAVESSSQIESEHISPFLKNRVFKSGSKYSTDFYQKQKKSMLRKKSKQDGVGQENLFQKMTDC